ncbi:hypothetical protein TNCT_567411 [Trichonephila clavata]|uniref:Uncharacterized protein n=1 Tax=Trichonephila clavata TaxID=2740835 RepID=A0A8X6KXI3_TRICU|nr:hypothetical protein TNCT_567411 [Trichonephila clavata]
MSCFAVATGGNKNFRMAIVCIVTTSGCVRLPTSLKLRNATKLRNRMFRNWNISEKMLHETVRDKINYSKTEAFRENTGTSEKSGVGKGSKKNIFFPEKTWKRTD